MRVHSVGDVAHFCKVSPRTVSTWFDKGLLKGYRVPGTQDRRIPHEYLLAFMREHNLIIPPELSEKV